MRTALLLFALSGLACGPSEAAERYLERSADGIVGGEVFTGLPAVGALVYYGNPHCTATVIGERTLLTAAHCVIGINASGLQFAIGPSLSNVTAVVGVSSVRAHPNYNAQSISNDVATVTLSADSPVAPMPLLTEMSNSDVGDDFLFVGYGVNNGIQQSGSGIKRAVWMTIDAIQSTTFYFADPSKNTCNGDSGGPAFAQRDGELFVAGITSYGDVGCTTYGVDTRVDAFLDFIGLDDEEEPTEDPCNGETYTGRCDADTAIWCENEQVYSSDCVARGKQCGFSTTYGWYDCL